MTSLETPTRSPESRSRIRSQRDSSSTSRRRRTGIVSEAVVARYIRDLAEHGRRVQGALIGPQVATR